LDANELIGRRRRAHSSVRMRVGWEWGQQSAGIGREIESGKKKGRGKTMLHLFFLADPIFLHSFMASQFAFPGHLWIYLSPLWWWQVLISPRKASHRPIWGRRRSLLFATTKWQFMTILLAHPKFHSSSGFESVGIGHQNGRVREHRFEANCAINGSQNGERNVAKVAQS
jgi:hypothetical protein